uniref:5-methyltetrahydropteroyltriglutamate--homocysteine S-methyltransferase n=1 Tax=Hirondellea gigas TaxID=1518452 RepID=A0A6A7G514_9CRUS
MKVITIGYPRIGLYRELKKSVERFWKGNTSQEELLKVSHNVFLEGLNDQANAKVDLIGIGSHSLYDHVLDWTVRLGLIPKRFVGIEDSLKRYFAMARGVPDIGALDMTKWFDTNYHNLTPEIDAECLANADSLSDWSNFLSLLKDASKIIGKDRVGAEVLGPFTLAKKAELSGVSVPDVVRGILPVYLKLFSDIKALGVAEIQIHEPIFVLEDLHTPEFKALAIEIYTQLASAGVPLNLVSYFDDLGSAFPWVCRLPGVTAVSLDFTRGNTLALLKEYGFPEGVRLGAGVVDGRSVWGDQRTALPLLNAIKAVVPSTVEISVQPSCSLLHIPIDVTIETAALELLASGSQKVPLRFARQKLVDLREFAAQFESPNNKKDTKIANLADSAEEIDEKHLHRELPFAKRRPLQLTELNGILLPTSTIGSFPQTKEMRRVRLKYRKKQVSEKDYFRAVDDYISYCIGLQEGIGLDVLVHGEPERSDMIEYFAEQMTGYLFTTNGWVQSYGSRYIRVPIIYGDVTRRDNKPMTTREFKVAQSKTSRPVKGMLTGPVTLLNWSFPRKDISRKAQAFQLGKAIRGEIADLETAGCRIIQVDEPALREGLPLRVSRRAEYLDWAVRAFRLATAIAKSETHIVTHFCYSEFGDILDGIKAMDADQITIENSRSGSAMLKEFVSYGLVPDFSPGIYDVHSSVVPPLELFKSRLLDIKNSGLPIERFWVVPDCGLKTRGWPEVIGALRNLVFATEQIRKKLN